RATAFYERTLWESDAGAFARDYLASRGLGEEVCRHFRLGYAPGPAMLVRRALQEGYTQEEVIAAGLATRRGNDYFQRRLVFRLAVTQSFDVEVVPLAKGTDPADDPAAFERQLRSPSSYPLHRVRLEYERARDKQAAFVAIRDFLGTIPDSPEYQDALRLAADLL